MVKMLSIIEKANNKWLENNKLSIIDYVKIALHGLVTSILLYILLNGIIIISLYFLPSNFPAFSEISTSAKQISVGLIAIAYFIKFNSLIRSLDSYFDFQRTVTLIGLLIASVLTLNRLDSLFTNLTYVNYLYNLIFAALLIGLLHIIFSKIYLSKKFKPKDAVYLSDDSNNLDINLSTSQNIIKNKISNIVKFSSGQSVAVTGGWGTGKTLIINKIKSETKKDVLWIPFFPWAYTNEAALISDFDKTITSELDKVNQRLTFEGNQLGRSIQRLIKSENVKGPIAGITTFIMDLFSSRMEPEEIIADRLKRTNKKVVILIDDLERVSSKKVINRTLQLVHHLKRAGITRVTFITMFERNSVTNSLPSHIKSTERDYFIEKFFDIEITLPDPLNLDILETLNEMIPAEFLPQEISEELVRDIRSYRSIIKMSNDLRMAEVGIEINGLVHIGDFLTLTHIKLDYPYLYNDISKNRQIYTQFSEGVDGDAFKHFVTNQSEHDAAKSDHIEKLIKKHSNDPDRNDRLRSLIIEIFPDLKKPLTGISNSYDTDIMRQDRRIGLRMVLDAALGITDKLSIFSRHEEKANKVIDLLKTNYSLKELSVVIDELVYYGVNLHDESWLLPFNIMTREINNRDELIDNVPNITRAMIKSALQLDINYEDSFKTHLIGHAIYLFVDTNWRLTTKEEREKLVEELRLDLLINSSKTPFGSLLLYKMSMNQEARELKIYIPKNVTEILKSKARADFEKYYCINQNDMVQESPDLVHYLIEGWEELTSKSKTGTAKFNKWLKEIHSKHPSFFLDEFIMATYKGNLAFRSKNGDISSPADGLSPERLKKLKELVKDIRLSENLSRYDKSALKMINEYSQSLNKQSSGTKLKVLNK